MQYFPDSIFSLFYPFTFSFLNLLCSFTLCSQTYVNICGKCECVSQYTCEGYMAACRSWFSPSIMWDPRDGTQGLQLWQPIPLCTGAQMPPAPHSGCFCAGYSGIHNLSVLWHHIFLLIIVEMIWGWDKVMLPSWELFLIRVLRPRTAWDRWHSVFNVTRRAVEGQDAPLHGGPCPFISFRSCSLTLLSFNKEKKINSGEEDRDVSVLLIDQDLIREAIM